MLDWSNVDQRVQLAPRQSVTAWVPRFFFHLYDDIVARDEEGQELPDADAARRVAIASARDMVCAEVLNGQLDLKHHVDVEDENGAVVATVTFREVVNICG